MLMTVAECRQFVSTEITDQVLQARLEALESLIRAYTNNNFMNRAYRCVAVAVADGKRLLTTGHIPFKVGDTLQITESDFMQNQLVTVASVADGVITVNEDVLDESGVVITKVVYPKEIKLGACGMLEYDLTKRDKIGIASETISRHSISYSNLDASNTVMSYPAAVVGFLRQYKKARFGQGL